jgi:NAD(P)H-hydrate repair Nnr-like enzyme with NAD(P)H-hydrate epimerase domain
VTGGGGFFLAVAFAAAADAVQGEVDQEAQSFRLGGGGGDTADAAVAAAAALKAQLSATICKKNLNKFNVKKYLQNLLLKNAIFSGQISVR